MIRVHIQPAGIHDAWIELKEADGRWFLNFAKDKHDFHRDPGHIWAGIPVAPHVAESLVRQAQAIVKRKDPHVSLTILDGAVITVSLADGPVEQRHHFNIPQPGKPEATFLRELLALAASSIEAPAFVDYHEWLEQALFQASPVRVRTGPPYTVRLSGLLSSSAEPEVLQAFEELARRPAAVLDMRNFIAAAGMFHAVIASVAHHPGLVVHANAAARTLLLHLGFPHIAFKDAE